MVGGEKSMPHISNMPPLGWGSESHYLQLHNTCATLFLTPIVSKLNLIHYLPSSLTRGVAQCSLAISIKKYLKGKKRNYKNSEYFTMQKYNLRKKILLKNKIKILQDIILL
jgi:hypothetical protein